MLVLYIIKIYAFYADGYCSNVNQVYRKKRYVNRVPAHTFHFNYNKKILTKYKIKIEYWYMRNG